MRKSRRSFLKAAAIGAAGAVTRTVQPARAAATASSGEPSTHRSYPSVSAVGDRVAPWIEVNPSAFRHNIEAISTYTNNRKVLAVLKCNAYGLDPATVASYIDSLPQLAGFAVTKMEEAYAVRASGARKPILMLCDVAASDALDLVRHNVALSTDSVESRARLKELARRAGQRVPVHIQIDAGLGRLGVPVHEADEWVAGLIGDNSVAIQGIFCPLAEVVERARAHLELFRSLVERLRKRGYDVGKAHAASSHAIANLANSGLDMVRPGLMCHGSLPDGASDNLIALTVAHRLRGRVTRVHRLEPGDGVGYSQKFIATTRVWTASIMCGWSDGYYFAPLRGSEVLIADRRYPVIGLTANTSVINLGTADTAPIQEGAIATLVGPEPGLRPNDLAAKTDGSEYNQIRYSAGLPKFIAT